MLARDELSILIDDQKLVSESLDWFNGLWASASAPVIDEGDELVKTLDELQWTAPRSRVRLSSSAVKVKSILATSARPSGFDVASSFAKSSLTESFNLLPLEEAYQKVSDEWFSINSSFTFRELLEAVTKHQPRVTNNELWALIIRETVNHWLGGLFIDGFDRYVYEDGKFEKWGHSKLTSVVEIDNFLRFVIETIEHEPKTSYLPFENVWLELNVPEHHILSIVDQLINVGLLIEIDNAGELEMHSIDTEFEWPERWQKFTQAHRAFADKQKSISKSNNYDEIKDEYDGTFVESSDYLDSLVANWELKKITNTEIKATLDEIKNTAYQLGVTREELIATIEQSLISLFADAQKKGDELVVNDIERAYKKYIAKKFPSKLKATFRDYRHGPFVTKKFWVTNIAKHNSNDGILINQRLASPKSLINISKNVKKMVGVIINRATSLC